MSELIKTDNAFEKAFYRTCKLHPQERYPFYKGCWKCDLLSCAHSIRDLKMLITGMKRRRL
jgi:hypothetical protein